MSARYAPLRSSLGRVNATVFEDGVAAGKEPPWWAGDVEGYLGLLMVALALGAGLTSSIKPLMILFVFAAGIVLLAFVIVLVLQGLALIGVIGGALVRPRKARKDFMRGLRTVGNAWKAANSNRLADYLSLAPPDQLVAWWTRDELLAVQRTGDGVLVRTARGTIEFGPTRWRRAPARRFAGALAALGVSPGRPPGPAG